MKQKVTGYCTLVLCQNFQAPKQTDQLGVSTNSQDARDRIAEFFINFGRGLGFSGQVFGCAVIRRNMCGLRYRSRRDTKQ